MADYQTTVRLDPQIKASLDALKSVQKFTLNRLVNEALVHYIDHVVGQKSAALDQSLAALAAYRRADPGFEAAIGRAAAGEASGPDPMEGAVISESGAPDPDGPDPSGKAETEILGILSA